MDEIDLAPAGPGRCRLAVRAQPGARRSGIAGVWNRHVKVAVRSPPEDGRANREIAEVLADALGLARGEIELVSGEKGRLKSFAIARDPSEVRARLLAILG